MKRFCNFLRPADTGVRRQGEISGQLLNSFAGKGHSKGSEIIGNLKFASRRRSTDHSIAKAVSPASVPSMTVNKLSNISNGKLSSPKFLLPALNLENILPEKALFKGNLW